MRNIPIYISLLAAAIETHRIVSEAFPRSSFVLLSFKFPFGLMTVFTINALAYYGFLSIILILFKKGADYCANRRKRRIQNKSEIPF